MNLICFHSLDLQLDAHIPSLNLFLYLFQSFQERERDFLGQLAALSQLGKDELNNMVHTAIAGMFVTTGLPLLLLPSYF